MPNINDENIFSTGAKKLYRYPDRIEKWVQGKPIPPIALEIQPSERCNHHCPRCQSKYSMPLAEANNRANLGSYLDVSLLDNIWANPPEGIIISGHTGDPLMHPSIDKILFSIAKHNIGIALITNGQALNANLAEIIINTCEGVRISLDAYDPTSFKLTHGVGEDAWHGVLENIRILVNAKRRAANQEYSCDIGIGYLTDANNTEGMYKAALLAKELGVDYIQYRPFHYYANEIEKEFKACQAISEDKKFEVICSAQKYNLIDHKQRPYSACHASAFYSVLDARGDIYICCHHVGWEKAKVGSLKECTWEEILKRRTKNNISNQFPNKRCVPLCRLHPHNIELNRILQKENININDMPIRADSDKWARHSKYL